jgi:hypothetical protein
MQQTLSLTALAVTIALAVPTQSSAASPAIDSGERPAAQLPAAPGFPILLDEITAWLRTATDLPPASTPPRIAFVSPEAIAAMRYRGLAGGPRPRATDRGEASGSAMPEVVAVYEDETRTVYLPVGWTGETPAEVSVLVHEVVHHLQNLASSPHECPQAREKAAYDAQGRWLARFGRSLQTEFEIDPMTLLVRTSCGM